MESTPTPASRPGCPMAAYDPIDPVELQDPYPGYAAARRDAPVFRSDPLGLWFITRHADVAAAIRDTATFSSRVKGMRWL